MSDNTEQPGGGSAAHDPWAPPDSRVDLGKPAGDARPPTVHDQPTMTYVPGAGPGPGQGMGPGPVPGAGAGPGPGPIPGPGPAGFGPPTAGMPAPPMAPNGPGPMGPPPTAQYGYPAAPAAPYGGYAGYPGYGGQAAWGPVPSNGLGTAALVIGIIAVVFFCMWGLGIVLGILALIFGIVGRGRARRGEATNGGMALAGIILGSVSIAISAAFLGFLIWGLANAEHSDDYDYDDPYSTSLVVDAR